MKWLMIGIVIFGLGCTVLKHHSYPKPCESSPLKFNKKTGLYECVDIECFRSLNNKNTNWYKLTPKQLTAFLGKPQEKKIYDNIQIFTYKTNESSCKLGPFVRQSFGILKFGFKNDKLEYASKVSLIEPEPMK